MRKFLSLFVVLVLMLTSSQAFPASRPQMPRGVKSFSPTGTVQENVSFRVVFTSPMVTRNQTGKSITPENPLFPFTVNPPLQLEGKWQSDKIFIANLISPLRNATTYTASLKDDLRDRRGNSLEGVFRFNTEGLSPTDIKASMSRDGNAYFTLTFNMKVDPARLKGFMRILNSEGKEMSYSINGALPSRTIRASVPVKKLPSRQKFTVQISAGLKAGEGDLGIERDINQTVILDPVLIVQELKPEGENVIRANLNFGVDPQTVRNFINIEPPV
ncbi:MAG: hypothetical protein IJG36_00760, partial [Synergistaceae bacterium]|nr:hypothetical protein [Synergistaceae bacterium]